VFFIPMTGAIQKNQPAKAETVSDQKPAPAAQPPAAQTPQPAPPAPVQAAPAQPAPAAPQGTTDTPPAKNN
jgi:hypothetical protein